MIQTQTILNVADNTGDKKVMCIRVLGGTRRRYAGIGDVIIVAVKEAAPRGTVRKKTVERAVIVRTGDTVVVITGKDKGKTGTILRVMADDHRVVIGGINMRTRHIKKTFQEAGKKIQFEASIHASNVMLVDPKSKKRSRVGYMLKDGKMLRISKESGSEVTKVKAVKAVKKAKTETKAPTE